MKLPSSFHNPEAKKYTMYYSIVLAMSSITILLTVLQISHQNPLSSISYFEGAFAVFMLSRTKQVRNWVWFNMSKIKDITRQSIPLAYNI